MLFSYVACAEELVNLTNMILPIACTNQSCLVDPSDYSTINRFECNGVTECGDCSDECHCQPNTYRRSQEACRVAGANMSSICGECCWRKRVRHKFGPAWIVG